MIPDEVTDLLRHNAATGAAKALLFRVDGAPSYVGTVLEADVADESEAGRADERAADGFVAEVKTSVAAVKSLKPEADLLRALSLAASHAEPDGTIVLMDSGLQTVDPLNFAVGLPSIDESPEQVLNGVRTEHLPRLDGLNIVFVGIGDVAPPQRPLTERQHENLVEIWKVLAKGAGAKCVSVVVARASGASALGLSVSIVPVPTESFGQNLMTLG